MRSGKLASKLLVLVCLAGILFSLVGCAGGQSTATQAVTKETNNTAKLDKIVFRLDWITTGYQAPYYYALDKGFYKDEGLDVSVLPGQGSGPGLMAVISGADTFGLIDPSLMAKYVDDSAPVKMVMGVFQKTPFAILSSAQKGIKKPSDLVGKSIAASPGGATQIITPTFLKKNNIDLKQVNIVSMDPGSLIPSVASGKVDAIISWGFMQVPLMKAAGVKEVNLLPYGDYGVNMPVNGIVTSNKILEEKPEMVRKFLKATIKGIEEAKKNPDAAIQAMAKYHPEEIKGKESVHKEILIGFYDYLSTKRTASQPIGWMSEDDWKEATDTLLQYNVLKKPISDFKVLYSNEFLPR